MKKTIWEENEEDAFRQVWWADLQQKKCELGGWWFSQNIELAKILTACIEVNELNLPLLGR